MKSFPLFAYLDGPDIATINPMPLRSKTGHAAKIEAVAMLEGATERDWYVICEKRDSGGLFAMYCRRVTDTEWETV